MILLLSPAKRQAQPGDPSLLDVCHQESVPIFPEEARSLRKALSVLSPAELRSVFSLSEKKAKEVYRVYQGETAKTRALDLFRGPAFTSLLRDGFSERTCAAAERSLRILSGLYGLLRPFDRVESYRLDLEHRVPGLVPESLYEQWREKVNQALLNEPALDRDPVLLDLASKEYSALIDDEALANRGIRRIAPDFLTLRDGKEKHLSVHTKQGRGGLARVVLDSEASSPGWNMQELERTLRTARWEGFRYDDSRSTPARPLFVKEA